MQLIKKLKDSYENQFRTYPAYTEKSSYRTWALIIPFLLAIGCSLWCLKELETHQPPTLSNDLIAIEPVSIHPPAGWKRDISAIISSDARHEAEALQWMILLNTYDDQSLEPEQLAKKYLNLTIASTILSGTGKGKFRQRFWSSKAIQYGIRAMTVYATSVEGHSNETIDEVHTRVLLAMSLNFYQEGTINKDDLVNQFSKIDKTYLIRSGFCSNKLLRLLEDDKILQLPNYYSEIYI